MSGKIPPQPQAVPKAIGKVITEGMEKLGGAKPAPQTPKPHVVPPSQNKKNKCV